MIKTKNRTYNHSAAHPDTFSNSASQKPSVFDTMKNSSREEDKAVNRRLDAVSHSSLMKSIHQII